MFLCQSSPLSCQQQEALYEQKHLWMFLIFVCILQPFKGHSSACSSSRKVSASPLFCETTERACVGLWALSVGILARSSLRHRLNGYQK